MVKNHFSIKYACLYICLEQIMYVGYQSSLKLIGAKCVCIFIATEEEKGNNQYSLDAGWVQSPELDSQALIQFINSQQESSYLYEVKKYNVIHFLSTALKQLIVLVLNEKWVGMFGTFSYSTFIAYLY